MALLSALFLFGPGLINTESYKKKILTDISREVNGEVQFQKVDFSFFPWPHLRIHQGSLSISGKGNAVFESMSIFPKILPLFKKGLISNRGYLLLVRYGSLKNTESSSGGEQPHLQFIEFVIKIGAHNFAYQI